MYVIYSTTTSSGSIMNYYDSAVSTNNKWSHIVPTSYVLVAWTPIDYYYIKQIATKAENSMLYNSTYP